MATTNAQFFIRTETFKYTEDRKKFEEERSTIKYIAIRNGYHSKVIDTIIKKLEIKLHKKY